MKFPRITGRPFLVLCIIVASGALAGTVMAAYDCKEKQVGDCAANLPCSNCIATCAGVKVQTLPRDDACKEVTSGGNHICVDDPDSPKDVLCYREWKCNIDDGACVADNTKRKCIENPETLRTVPVYHKDAHDPC